MRVFWILLVDSLRMLKAQKMFWIVLGISFLVALFYASIGFHEEGYSVFFGLKKIEDPFIREGSEMAKAFYILLFTDFIARYWFGVAAIFLALVSCGSIFPEFLRKGSIDLALSKPVGRLSLFTAKYLSSLLFVFVQVSLFAVVVFVAIGVRLGEWNGAIFWSVPILVFVFSLIYCVSVWVAVRSQSTVLGLLAAIGMWAVCLVAQWAENLAYQIAYTFPQAGVEMDFGKGGMESAEVKEDAGSGAKGIHSAIKAAITPLPKTRELTLSLNRLIRFDDGEGSLLGRGILDTMMGMETDPTAKRAVEKTQARFSLGYIIGTSLAFEIVVLGFAACRFCRMDF